MEKLNLVNRNGVVRLPPGFRFHPTDEELVVQYLKRKALSFPLPASIIPDVEVCKSDPWDLPGDSEQERYFFSTREAKYPNGNRSNRATGSGYWKATGIDKQILSSNNNGINNNNNNNQIVGMKKTLVFYRGKPPHGSRTDWIMHEYRLVTAITVPKHSNSNSNSHTQVDIAGMENWVLCRIFLKKRGTKNEEESRIGVEKQVMMIRNKNDKKKNDKPVLFYDFMTKERRADLNVVPSSPSSNMSGVTELSSSNDSEEHEETSTCGNSSSNFSTKQT